MKIDTTENKNKIMQTLSFISNTLDISVISEEYDKQFKGFGGKANVEQIYSFIFNTLCDNNLLYAVDWKWSIEDELFNIKKVVPNFDY